MPDRRTVKADDRRELHARAVAYAAKMLKTYFDKPIALVDRPLNGWNSGPDLFLGNDSVCVRASRSKFAPHRAKTADGECRIYRYWRLQWSLNNYHRPCAFEPDFWCLVGYSEGTEPVAMMVPREKLARRGTISVLLQSLDRNFLSQYML